MTINLHRQAAASNGKAVVLIGELGGGRCLCASPRNLLGHGDEGMSMRPLLLVP